MTTNTKLTKVLEYLIKNDEEKAKEILHQVFIEKARAIHEELISMDEEIQDEDLDETSQLDMDETVGGSGDEGKDLTSEIEAMEDEIDFEETMSEDDDEPELDADSEIEMGPGDAEEGGEASLDSVEGKMEDLEAALAALKAEFERLEAGEEGEEGEAGEEGEEGEAGEEEESWELDEDFDEIAESLDLEVVERDMLKTNKTAKDAGAASSGMTTGNDAKSPVPPSQTSRMGAKPVVTGQGPTENGYALKAAPKSAKMAGTDDNRRRKASDGASAVKKEGDSAALINKSTSDGFGAINNTSPLSKGGQNLK
jgi:hypothetical protein